MEVGEMNKQVYKKYFEVSLNLTPGEQLKSDKFLQIAQEYMLRMGYGNCCYAVILHKDREHQHLHILSTTVDYDAMHINDSNIRRKSQSISRELEVKYNLKEVEYNKFKSKSLSKIKERQYYFSNALDKGLRNFSTKTELMELLSDDVKLVQDNHLTNTQLELLLGKDVYNEVGGVLEKNNLFVNLYKDELLQQLDSCYNVSKNKYDFFENVHAAGLYVRTLTDKDGKLKLTYGLPNASIYFKEERIPQRYRYATISRFLCTRAMSADEQKKSIALKAIVALKNSNSFESYLVELDKIGVVARLLENSGGIYGISFKLKDVEDAIIFKASDITANRAFSFANIIKYFSNEVTPLNEFLKGSEKVSMSSTMKEETQKAYIRDQVRQILPTVKNTEELRKKLSQKGISLWVRKNNTGEVKGFSFKITACANSLPIKARDISANFDKELFRGVQTLHGGRKIESINQFESFTIRENKVEQGDSIVSNNPAIQQPTEYSEVSRVSGDLQNDDTLSNKKKKKKKIDMDFGR